VQAIDRTATVPIVRVPWLEPGIVMKSLDAGAMGLICPMINTREDAQRLVAYTHYAPRGTRSFGPIRAAVVHGPDYAAKANDTVVVFAMIETAQALDHLDAILSVEGLDAIYIGPSDLSLALGCRPVFDDVDPKAAQAMAHILERAKAHGVRAGVHNGVPEVALARAAMGFDLVTLGSDARLITCPLAKKACRLSNTRCAIAARVSSVALPMCGTITTLSRPINSAGTCGSCSKTSSAAPAMRRSTSARTSAGSSITEPRATFTTYPSGPSASSTVASTRWCVAPPPGTMITRKSAQRARPTSVGS
jgi:4-hydroxy-2-oxoheptanedioate aldolase